MAKQANVDVSIKTLPPIQKQTKSPNIKSEDIGEIEDLEEKPLPTIPEALYQSLPDFLQRVTTKATSAEDKDLLLLGSLVAISPCLPNIYGVYAERNVYPNLFLFVTAQASAGKGRLTLCRKLVEPIHKALREQNKAENGLFSRFIFYTTNTKRYNENPHFPINGEIGDM